MGSLEKAMLTGFICRLCSEMHRVVLHIYGAEGTKLCISEKIRRYLSINVSRSDPLPKTICKTCLSRLESQHQLMLQFASIRQRLQEQTDKRLLECGVGREPPSSDT